MRRQQDLEPVDPPALDLPAIVRTRTAGIAPTPRELEAINELRIAVLAVIEAMPSADGARYAAKLLTSALTVTEFLGRATRQDVDRPHALAAGVDEHGRSIRRAMGLS